MILAFCAGPSPRGDVTNNGLAAFVDVDALDNDPLLAISNKVAFVPMPNNSRLIGLFRNASRMNMFAGGNVFNFRLDGTNSLLPALARCVALNRGS